MLVSPAARDLLGSFRVADTVSAPPEAVVDIITSRCSMCHTSQPVWPGIQVAPKGVILNTGESIRREAGAIRLEAVLTQAMPPNNITRMTEEERRSVANWLVQQ
jgi:uncharacterized membrane protein